MAELESQLASIHRSLMDGLSHADELVSGSRDGFHIDAICKAMSDVLDYGNTCFEHHAQKYTATQEAEFDPLQIASDFLNNNRTDVDSADFQAAKSVFAQSESPDAQEFAKQLEKKNLRCVQS